MNWQDRRPSTLLTGGYITSGECLRDLINKYYDNPIFINRVVATHNDGDHARGLIAILEHFEVGELWMLRPWEYAEELIERFDTYESVPHLQALYGVRTLTLQLLKI